MSATDFFYLDAVIPEIEIDDGYVYVQGIAPPLKQYQHEQTNAGLEIFGCEMCAWTGIDLFSYQKQIKEACRHCAGIKTTMREFTDEDHDRWLDHVSTYRARYDGGIRDLSHVSTIVFHRLAKGRDEAGPRYVSKPGLKRHVSWHYTVHRAGFSRSISQHLPINRIG